MPRTLLACLLLVVACSSDKKGGKPGICDRSAIDRALEGIGSSSDFVFAAAVTAEACKLPAPLESALEEITRMGDCLGAARGIAEAPDLFLKACPAGHSSVQVFQSHPPSEANAMFSETCQLPRLGFATQSELASAHHWACTIVGSMVFVTLDEAGEPNARTLARLIVLDRP